MDWITQPDGPERCIAIRTHINENDASRLVRTSKAFTRPVSVPRKQPHRWLYAYIVAALLALGTVIGGTLFYTFKKAPVTVAAEPKQIQTATARVESTGGGYFLLYNHKICGPYPAKVVADMSANGLFNDETMCRPENSTEWGKVAAAFPRVAQN